MSRGNPRPRIWHTATFRLAIIFSVIFGIGSASLLIALDFAMAAAAQTELEDSLRSQMAIMRADANLEGGEALIEVLDGHRASGHPTQYSYLVVTPAGQRFVAGLPDDFAGVSGFSRVTVRSTNSRPGMSEEVIDVLVLDERANDGTLMAVGRDTSALDKLRGGLHRIALAGGVGLTILAVGAGLVLGFLLLRRLESVSEVAERVLNGRTNERLPAIGLGREFDALVSNLNRMLDRLDQTMSALRQVSGDIAHDLRTPLTRLRSVLEEAAAGGDRADALERAIEETDEILMVFNALLRIAQVEGGDRRSSFGRIDVTTLLAELTEIYRPEAEDSGRSLQNETATGLYARGDRLLLKQLVSNLLENAMRHTPTGSVIVLAASHQEDRVTISVADNGLGVPSSELPHIAKRFYRLDRSRSTPGAGLGLTLASAIAELHDSTLLIENLSPGLRVSFSLEADRELAP